MDKLNVLGVEIDDVTVETATDRMTDAIAMMILLRTL